jgi:hypothetical protein
MHAFRQWLPEPTALCRSPKCPFRTGEILRYYCHNVRKQGQRTLRRGAMYRLRERQRWEEEKLMLSC